MKKWFSVAMVLSLTSLSVQAAETRNSDDVLASIKKMIETRIKTSGDASATSAMRQNGFSDADIQAKIDELKTSKTTTDADLVTATQDLRALQVKSQAVGSAVDTITAGLSKARDLFASDSERKASIVTGLASLEAKEEELKDSCNGLTDVSKKTTCLADVRLVEADIANAKSKCLVGDEFNKGLFNTLATVCDNALKKLDGDLTEFKKDSVEIKKVVDLAQVKANDLTRKSSDLEAKIAAAPAALGLGSLGDSLDDFTTRNQGKQIDLKLLSMSASQLQMELASSHLTANEARDLLQKIAEKQRKNLDDSVMGKYVIDKIGSAFMSCELFDLQQRTCDVANKPLGLGQKSIYDSRNPKAGEKDAIIKALSTAQDQ